MNLKCAIPAVLKMKYACLPVARIKKNARTEVTRLNEGVQELPKSAWFLKRWQQELKWGAQTEQTERKKRPDQK